MNSLKWPIDKSWTLFLDRDGVINHRIVGGYVSNWDEFQFLDGVLEALAMVAGKFGTIVVVSNQQGIGKGLVTVNQVEEIHRRMAEGVKTANGRIDKVFYSPYLEAEQHPDRKPGTGMGFKAKKIFPGIDFSKSVMVGDSKSDMQFGKALGMKTIFISGNDMDEDALLLADGCFKSLLEFAKALAG